MKRTKTKDPARPCQDYIHSLPKKLADVLHQPSGDRYTKFEAFRDLMQRQAVQNSDESKNHTSPFFVTVSELSVLWGWHRHTVSAFLEKLSALEYLTIEKVTNGFNLHLIALFVPDL